MGRRRLRDWGLTVGQLPTGPTNTIMDVRDVRVGHVTLKQNDPCMVRTGVTAVLPHGDNWFRHKVVAASHIINGFGKTTGLVQVGELGVIESPIMLTNTFGVPAVVQGTLQLMMERDSEIGAEAGSLNVVAGECNDGYLNDMRGLHVQPDHAIQAIRSAEKSCHVVEGNVGAGTGMVCLGWKGGIGTASRRIDVEGKHYYIGVLVLSNFGEKEDLTVLGQPVGSLLKQEKTLIRRKEDGSIMIVLGTDLPMDARQLKRLARRGALGLSRTGSIAHHGSGDIVIAFSNGNRIPHTPTGFQQIQSVPENGPLISQCFRAVVEGTEEAILNSLFMAEDTEGRQGRIVQGLPVDEIVSFLITNRH